MICRNPSAARSLFLSASTADYTAARGVLQQLTEAGWVCFFCDEAQLRAGERGYLARVDRELGAAGALVVVAGHRDGVESEWVRYAWRRFSERKAGRVVTVLAEGMAAEDLPRKLRGGVCVRFPEEGHRLEAALSGQALPQDAGRRAGRWNRLAVAVTLVNLCFLGVAVWLLRDRLAGNGTKAGTEEVAAAGGLGSGGSGNSPSFDRHPPGQGRAGGGGEAAGASAAQGAAGAGDGMPDGDGAGDQSAGTTVIVDSLEGSPVPGTVFRVTVGDGVRQSFAFVPAGKFVMGSPVWELGREADETQREVNIEEGFWMARTECTVSLWNEVMGFTPQSGTGDHLPEVSVTWEEVAGEKASFLSRLNGRGLLPGGWRFALPREEQWEYACRAGTTTPFHFGSVLNGGQANCDGGLPYGTDVMGPFLSRPVKCGSYVPNAWGLYDMHGNVWEWCGEKIRRGGGWRFGPAQCRSANREAGGSDGDDTLGFRVAIVRE